MSKWVSVKERLPPFDEKVLCYYKEKIDGRHEEGCISFALYYGENRFIVLDQHAFAHVIAWMPLPKPPKEANKQISKQISKQRSQNNGCS